MFGARPSFALPKFDMLASNSADASTPIEEEVVPKFLRGISLENSACTCDRDRDCRSDEYCHSTDCLSNRAMDSFTGGKCRTRNSSKGRSCNYKQCEHKSNSSKCSCRSDEFCVKNDDSCTLSGDDNGCCVTSEVAEGYFLG